MRMIREVLGTGAESAIPGRELCEVLGISSRDLMSAVERERRDGAPICASSGSNPGYYLAKDKSEMEAYCKYLFHRGAETMKTYRACCATAEAMAD